MPDFRTWNRRQNTLKVSIPYRPKQGCKNPEGIRKSQFKCRIVQQRPVHTKKWTALGAIETNEINERKSAHKFRDLYAIMH